MKTSFFLTLVLCASAACGATRNVFFAGGQSNAKQVWADALTANLQSGYGDSLVMVWVNHSGEPIGNWFTDAPKANYSNDLFNAQGTGLLQSRLAALAAAGDTAVFQGFFWFQGEGDTGTPAAIDAWTNRFTAMTARLKADLALTNDVRFSLAVIDANPGPEWDDDLTGMGRTRAAIEAFRANQFSLTNSPAGTAVDTRGYARTDLWHLPAAELQRLAAAQAADFIQTFGASLPPPEERLVYSHTADGTINDSGGLLPDNGLMAGNAAGAAPLQLNGLCFFPLPSNRVETADLILPVVEANAAWAAQNTGIDVWGLGFIRATPALNAAWLLSADTDSRVFLNGFPPVKLADDLVPPGTQPTVGAACTFDAASRSNLLGFIDALYAAGAMPGDHAVIRVNPDAPVTAQGVRVIFGASSETSPDRRARLSITLAREVPAPSLFTHFSHPNDGAVTINAAMNGQDLISGTGGAPSDWSGIAFYALPEQPLAEAKLAFTAVAGPVALKAGVNIDVWGLGWQNTPALNTAWNCTNDTDARVLLNGRPPVKLADNIVTSGQAVPNGTLWTPDANQSKALTRWLNSLYLNGAKPGDFAVVRVNMDAPHAPTIGGTRWGGSHRLVPDHRSYLFGRINPADNYLPNADFELGAAQPDGWQIAANGYQVARTNSTVRSGGWACRLATAGDQSANPNNNANIRRDVTSSDFAGKLVTLSCWARHEASEPLQNGQKIEIRMYRLNGSTQLDYINSTDTSNLLPTSPTNVWQRIILSAVMPANCNRIGAQVIYRSGTQGKPEITSGAAIVDDLRLTIFQPVYPPGTLLSVR
jgi:hypothetical protein